MLYPNRSEQRKKESGIVANIAGIAISSQVWSALSAIFPNQGMIATALETMVAMYGLNQVKNKLILGPDGKLNPNMVTDLKNSVADKLNKGKGMIDSVKGLKGNNLSLPTPEANVGVGGNTPPNSVPNSAPTNTAPTNTAPANTGASTATKTNPYTGGSVKEILQNKNEVMQNKPLSEAIDKFKATQNGAAGELEQTAANAAKGGGKALSLGQKLTTSVIPQSSKLMTGLGQTAAKGGLLGTGANVAKGLVAGLTSPLALGWMGLQGVNWLMGNNSKQWMGKVGDLLVSQQKIKPENKEQIVSMMMQVFDQGLQKTVEDAEEAESNQELGKVSLELAIVRKKKAFLIDQNILDFTFIKLQEQERDLVTYSEELTKKAYTIGGMGDSVLGTIGSIVSVNNIAQYFTDLFSQPEVEELIGRSVDEAINAKVIPADQKQKFVDEIINQMNKGIGALSGQEEKEQTPEGQPQENKVAPAPTPQQQMKKNIEQGKTETGQPVSTEKNQMVSDINGNPIILSGKQDKNGLLGNDSAGNPVYYNPGTRQTTPVGQPASAAQPTTGVQPQQTTSVGQPAPEVAAPQVPPKENIPAGVNPRLFGASLDIEEPTNKVAAWEDLAKRWKSLENSLPYRISNATNLDELPTEKEIEYFEVLTERVFKSTKQWDFAARIRLNIRIEWNKKRTEFYNRENNDQSSD